MLCLVVVLFAIQCILMCGLQSWTVDVRNDEIGLNQTKGVLQLTRLPFNPLQEASCYEYVLYSRINTSEVIASRKFCYPSIMITGHFKCSTSALFNLISQSNNVVATREKEPCIFGDMLAYFDKLPSPDYGTGHVLSGCIQLDENIKAAAILRRPRTFYIVLTRDFAELMWSAYNFWCNPATEYCSLPTQWVEPGKQNRSDLLFHEIVASNDASVPHAMYYVQPMTVCSYGQAAFLRMMVQIWNMSSVYRTLMLASEDLDTNLPSTVHLLSKVLQLKFNDSVLSNFSSVRYNTQSSLEAKGIDTVIEKSKYIKNVYAASQFRPMLDKTRALLNECWTNDCKIMSHLTGHRYTACSNKSAIPSGRNDGLWLKDVRSSWAEFKDMDVMHKITQYRRHIQSYMKPSTKRKTSNKPSQ